VAPLALCLLLVCILFASCLLLVCFLFASCLRLVCILFAFCLLLVCFLFASGLILYSSMHLLGEHKICWVRILISREFEAVNTVFDGILGFGWKNPFSRRMMSHDELEQGAYRTEQNSLPYYL
jgi:hypothetical protein